MVMCWAFGCNHYNVRETCKFFRFPKEPKLRKKWITALRRTDEPGPGAFVCSCHFKDQSRTNLPEIFSFNLEKRFSEHHLSPEKKKITKRKAPATVTSQAACTKASSSSDIVGRDQEVVVTTCTSETMPSTSASTGVNWLGLSIQDSITQAEGQTDKLLLSPTAIEAENLLLKISLEREQMRNSYLVDRFSYKKICHEDKLVNLYTGIPQKRIYDALFNLMESIDLNYVGSKVEIIDKCDQLLMTLMKLRQNFPHADLAFRFKVSESTVSNIIITWINALYEVLYKQLMGTVPSRNKNKLCLPNCFSTFTNCRFIIDCTEIYTAVPRRSLSFQKMTYSAYKHRNTFKGLVGTAPNGVITFLSDLYPGSISDKQIFKDCGIIEHLKEGDLLLADKGFLIRDALPPGVHLNIPPFLSTPQFTQAQIQQTEKIAKARIHVERAIRRMKCFKILNFIPYSLSKYADAVFKVVGALTNLQFPLIKEIENSYDESSRGL